MNKILAAGLIAATTALSANATQCGNGGFYMGAAIGASFNKASFKFDRTALNDNLDSGIKGLTEKVMKKQAEADKLFEAVDVTDLANEIEAVLNTIKLDLTKVAPKSGDYAAGTLAALSRTAKLSDTPLHKILNILIAADPDLIESDAFNKVLATGAGGEAGMKDILTQAVTKIAQQGKLGQLTTLFLTAAGQGSDTLPVLKYSTINLQIDTRTLMSASKDSGAIFEINKTYIPYKTALDSVATTMNNLKKAADADGKDATESVIKLFYTDTDRKTANTTAQFVEALSKYSTGIIDQELTELKVNSKDVASKKATGFLFAANFGFDHRINDVMLGIELEAGMEAGGKVKKKDLNKTDGLTVRRQFYVSLMPRVGYLFTPQFEGFLTFGGSLGKYKTDTSLFNKVFNHAGAVVEMSKQWNKDNPKDLLDTKVNNTEAANIYKKHSKTKFVPVIGAGVRYEITPEIFATLAYNYAFKTTVASQAKAGARVKFQSHILKAGVGFRF